MSNPRIIAGKARGFHLEGVPGDITRPITDRVKESLFNIIGGDIVGSSFLDLFGGTGSVGIEALSRGGVFARFIEINQTAAKVIQKNLKKTNLTHKAEVICFDAFKYLQKTNNKQFEYIFIAPPQYKKMWEWTLSILEANPDHLADDGWLIVQIDPLEYVEIKSTHFEKIDQRKYGSTLLLFFSKRNQSTTSI